MFYFFQSGDRLYTSESDVYRRQILTYKDGPRAERVKCNRQSDIWHSVRNHTLGERGVWISGQGSPGAPLTCLGACRGGPHLWRHRSMTSLKNSTQLWRHRSIRIHKESVNIVAGRWWRNYFKLHLKRVCPTKEYKKYFYMYIPWSNFDAVICVRIEEHGKSCGFVCWWTLYAALNNFPS